jgi:hypothetical protein
VGGRITTGQRDVHTSTDEKTHRLWEGRIATGQRDVHTSADEKTHSLWEGRIATGQRDVHISADEKTHRLWEGELQQVRETCTHPQMRKLPCCGRENCDRSERRAHIPR